MTDPTPAPAYQPAPVDSVPGKGLGIAALVLSFFFQLIALILGIIALNQSKKVGAKNTPAVVAIVLSILFGIGWIVLVTVLIVSGAALFGGLFGGLIEVCSELGSGEHYVDGVTYTCS